MELNNLTVEVRDVNLVRRGQIEDRYLDCKLEPKYLAPGNWTVKLPNEHPMADVLAEPGSGIIVTHTELVDVVSDGPVAATNLAVNPGMERPGATAAIRTNKAYNPRGVSPNVSGEYGARWSAVQSFTTGITDHPVGITTAVRHTFAAATGNGRGIDLYANYDVSTFPTTQPVVAGAPITVWGWVRTARARSVQLTARFHNGTAWVAAATNGPTVAVPANTWTRVSYTVTVPATGTHYAGRMQVVESDHLATDWLEISGLMVEPGAPLALPYFDGITSEAPDPDLTPAWTAAANASPSILRGVTVGGVAGGGTFQSSLWAASGVASLRITSTTASSDTKAAPGGDTGGMRLGMEGGKTYTALGTIRLSAPLTGVLHTRALRMVAFYKTPSTGYLEASSAVSANVPGATDLSVTFTLPADASEAFVRLYSGAPAGGGEVWWDDFMLVEGAWTGGYFDGSTPSTPELAYSWTGVADNSSSVVRTRVHTPTPVNTTLLSGPSRSPERTADRTDPQGTSTFTGTTDDVLLWHRRAYPTPGTADVAQQVVAYDVRQGIAETVMRAYVSANLGPGAPAVRKVAQLALAADLARGTTVNVSARFDVLGELLASIATVAGLGFRIVQVGAGLEFQVYDPTDKSQLIRLDMANGSLTSQAVKRTAPTLTRAIVAGQGVGEDRTLVEVANAADEAPYGIFGRIEGFIDQRNTDDQLELTQSGQEAILEGASGLAVQAIPGDDQTMAYPQDWGLGDVLGLVVDDTEATAQVTGVTILINASVGVRVGASIGDVQGWDPQAPIRRELKAQDERVSNLERNLEAGTSTVAPVGGNLNSLTRDGTWDVDTAALANSLLNLPIPSIPTSGANAGGMRGGSIGTLRVHVTPTRVVQEFTSLLSFGGNPKGYTHRRVRSSDGVTWGPWVLTDPPIPVRNESEQDVIAKALNARPDSPVSIRRLDQSHPRAFLTLNGDTWYSESGDFVSAPNWQVPTIAGWSSYGGSYLPAAYRRTASGIVTMRGLISGTTATANHVLFTLPVGNRPAHKLMFAVVGNLGSTRIDVNPDGTVSLTGTASGAAFAFLSLAGIQFPVAEVAPSSAWTPLAIIGGFADYSPTDPTWPPSGYWVDALGRYWFRGLVTKAGSIAADTGYANLPAAASPYRQIHVGTFASGGFSSQHISSGAVPQLVMKTGTTSLAFVSLPQQPILPTAVYPEAVWLNFALVGGWVNLSSDGSAFPKASLVQAADGLVHLRGLIASGGVGGTQIAGIGPGNGHTPLGSSIYFGNAANAYSRTDLGAGLYGLSANIGSNAWWSLENIVYLRES